LYILVFRNTNIINVHPTLVAGTADVSMDSVWILSTKISTTVSPHLNHKGYKKN